MGNCQAVDAAALVIQHPSGKIDRMYWPIPVSEVMKTNPGHYVSLIIPLPIGSEGEGNSSEIKTVKYTRVKLLRPTDTLVLGRAYRLVTSQEVMKVLRAKKHAKIKKIQQESAEKLQKESKMKNSNCQAEIGKTPTEKTNQATKHDKQKHMPGSTNFAAARSKSWRPSLQRIYEAGAGSQ